MGSDEKIMWHRERDGLHIRLPTLMKAQYVVGFEIELADIH
jgi:hypothetical protein